MLEDYDAENNNFTYEITKDFVKTISTFETSATNEDNQNLILLIYISKDSGILKFTRLKIDRVNAKLERSF